MATRWIPSTKHQVSARHWFNIFQSALVSFRHKSRSCLRSLRNASRLHVRIQKRSWNAVHIHPAPRTDKRQFRGGLGLVGGFCRKSEGVGILPAESLSQIFLISWRALEFIRRGRKCLLIAIKLSNFCWLYLICSATHLKSFGFLRFTFEFHS